MKSRCTFECEIFSLFYALSLCFISHFIHRKTKRRSSFLKFIVSIFKLLNLNYSLGRPNRRTLELALATKEQKETLMELLEISKKERDALNKTFQCTKAQKNLKCNYIMEIFYYL